MTSSSNANTFESIKISQTPSHFRPVRYEVYAKVDQLFGQTKTQKRQLALRHKDEDGNLWFDDLEEVEFRSLLNQNSNLQSPIQPFSSSEYFSRRSSEATCTSISLPSSPLSPFCSSKLSPFSSMMSGGIDFIPSNPFTMMKTTNNTRRRSSISTQTMMMMMKIDRKENRRSSISFEKSKHQSPISDSKINPFNFNDQIQSFPSKQGQDTIYERRRRKRVRSNDDENRNVDNQSKNRNKVNFDRFNSNIFQTFQNDYPPFDQIDKRKDNHIEMDIIMPNFLPISHHKIDSKTLDEAFGSIDRVEQKRNQTPNLQIESNRTYDQNHPYSPTISNSSSISPLTSYQDLKESFDLKHQRSDHEPNLNMNPSILSKKELLYKSKCVDSPDHQSIISERPKAAAMLGMTALNESLLVPGGLGTGEHVYDGIEIPCASVRLQSDDEDEILSVKNGLRSSRLRREQSKRTTKKITQLISKR